MKCSDCILWISRRLDGALGEPETKALETHLAQCARCRAELALQKTLVGSLKREIPPGLSTDFTTRVTQRAMAYAGAERTRRFRPAYLLPAAALAVAGVLLVIFGREISGTMAAAVPTVGPAIGRPFAAFGESVAEAFARGLTVSGEFAEHLGPLRHVVASAYFGMAIAAATVTWAFSRAYAFVKQ